MLKLKSVWVDMIIPRTKPVAGVEDFHGMHRQSHQFIKAMDSSQPLTPTGELFGKLGVAWSSHPLQTQTRGLRYSFTHLERGSQTHMTRRAGKNTWKL